MVKNFTLVFLLLSLLFFSCRNDKVLSERQVAGCRQVIEDYLADRSEDLSGGYEHRYLDKNIRIKYCHEKVAGEASKHYYVFITSDIPEFDSWEYDKKSSEDEKSYLVETIGKCSKFKFRFHVVCYGKVTLDKVEYYDEPKVFDTVFLMLFEHGKPKIAEIGGLRFIYEKDLPRLLENLGLQQSER